MSNFWDNVKKGPGCWEWQAAQTARGYGRTYFNGQQMSAHRVAIMLQGENIPKGMQVCHKCHNPICVRPDHLYIGTHKENMKDRVLAGAERNKSAIKARGRIHKDPLPDFSLLIVELQELGWTQVQVAEAIEVTQPAISRILQGKRTDPPASVALPLIQLHKHEMALAKRRQRRKVA